MDYPDLDGLLKEMRAATEKLRTQGQEATQLRLEWERQRTDDPELIKKLDQALAGELSWLDVMTSKEYREAHAAEMEEAIEDFERRRKEGTLPTPAEADAGLDEFFARMRDEVEDARQAAAEAPEQEQEPAQQEWVYRPTISDR